MNKTLLFKNITFIILAVFSSSVAITAAEKEITIMTHDSFSASKGLIADFQKREGIKLRFLKSGDAGAALNQAILSKNNPLADVFYGVDNTFLSRALKAGIFEAYRPALLSNIPASLKLDPSNRLIPVDFGDVCLNYDKKWFAKKGISPPESLEDLIKPAYNKLTVIENPATSSPGLAFLLTTIGYFGESGYLSFWSKLKKNNVLVTNGWNEAYWGAFTAASKGNRPIVVSYASSPPAEVHYSTKPLKEAPTAAITKKQTCFRQIEFVGILKGTQKRQSAEKVVDFLLSKAFQEGIPLQMFVFPSNRMAKLPAVFEKYTQVADRPVMLSPSKIAAGREEWIEKWTETVLR